MQMVALALLLLTVLNPMLALGARAEDGDRLFVLGALGWSALAVSAWGPRSWRRSLYILGATVQIGFCLTQQFFVWYHREPFDGANLLWGTGLSLLCLWLLRPSRRGPA